MIEIAEKVSFWIVFFVGVCAAIIGLLWTVDRALTWITRSLQIYTSIVEFMWKKYKKNGKTL